MPVTIRRCSSGPYPGTALRSTPAEKNRSRPAITTAAGTSAASPSSVHTSSSSNSRLIAFAGGRSTRTSTTSPLVSTETNTQRRLRCPAARAPGDHDGQAEEEWPTSLESPAPSARAIALPDREARHWTITEATIRAFATPGLFANRLMRLESGLEGLRTAPVCERVY